MMRGRLLTILLILLICAPVFADGMIIPGTLPHIIPDEPYFTVKYHHVEVEIEDQVCTTYVDQVFVNESRREMEGTYLFPLPPGAVVTEFVLIADGEEIEARLLDKDEAQKIYEEIVRKRKDPALLTYAGNNAYQARIYPIPPKGERRIELRYSEVLPYDNGLVSYLYPLSPEGLSHRPIESVVFTADIRSQQPIGSVYCPSHEIEVNRIGEHHVRASYEANDVLPERDVLLYYNVAQDPVGLSLVTFKEAGDDGFYLLLAAPTVEENESEVLPKNICFVLDTSGSMGSDDKIEQAKDALDFCVSSLNREDNFNIIAFSDRIKEFAGEMIAAREAPDGEARSFIRALDAQGGTDIDTALRTALGHRVAGEANYIVFLTDGQPTVGVTNESQIIKNVAEEMDEMERTPTRLFIFGVGYDVNTNFLDKLAQDNGGLTTYVRPTEDIEVKVSNFYSKISRPLLTEVRLRYGSVETYDEFPRELPDLFYGSQLEVFGRYKHDSAGRTTIRLSGTAKDDTKSFTLDCQFPEVKKGTDQIAALWAARKIGYLLDQIRLHGEDKELIDEIIRLSLEYGILTEYTAFLAEEDEAISLEEAEARLEGDLYGKIVVTSGAGATSRAQNAQVMQQQKQVGLTNTYLDAEGNRQRIANIQNVGQRGYVQRQGRWEDTRYQPDMKIALQVQAYSEAHFQLSRNFPQLNSQMSVGDNVLVILNNQVIEIGAAGKTVLTEAELKALGATQEMQTGARPDAQANPGLLAMLIEWLGGLFS